MVEFKARKRVTVCIHILERSWRHMYVKLLSLLHNFVDIKKTKKTYLWLLVQSLDHLEYHRISRNLWTYLVQILPYTALSTRYTFLLTSCAMTVVYTQAVFCGFRGYTFDGDSSSVWSSTWESNGVNEWVHSDSELWFLPNGSQYTILGSSWPVQTRPFVQVRQIFGNIIQYVFHTSLYLMLSVRPVRRACWTVSAGAWCRSFCKGTCPCGRISTAIVF